MQIIQIPEGLDHPIALIRGRPLEAGKEYICTNAFAGLVLYDRSKVSINGKKRILRTEVRTYSVDFDQFDIEEDWNGKDIWLLRGGGYGDLMLLTPLIRELRNRWPHTWIHVACGEQYQDVFDGLPVICELLPIPYDKQTRIDALIAFEDTVEGDPKAEELHMAQLFASRAGITLTDLKPDYIVTAEELAWVRSHYPCNSLPRVGVQFMPSGMYRFYPHMEDVILALSKKAQVFIIGSPGQVQLAGEIPNVINLTEHKLNFRQSAAVVSSCDVCVSPDSALVHLCSALDIPCVGIYGPFPPHLRLTSSLAYGFNGVAECSPCFFHADTPNQFPAGKPCAKAGKCVALDSIPAQEVVSKVSSYLPVPAAL